METHPLLEIKTELQVCKPVDEVFETIVNPEQMKNYFISESSGYMKEGEMVTWKFPEMEIEFPVRISKINSPGYISYTWDAGIDGKETLVEMNLQPVTSVLTLITITEKSKPNNEAGIKWLKSNTEGWANFLACLKAWMEYGVHLRKDAFNSSQLPDK